jgi:hypothetical protein
MEGTIDHKTRIEIHKEGYEILAKELGVVDFITFIQEFEKGEGNYTEDRHKWQDRYSVKEIIKDIKKGNF